jgi:hypothetical protein
MARRVPFKSIELRLDRILKPKTDKTGKVISGAVTETFAKPDEAVTVNFSAEDWSNFETAYGRPLPENVRSEIAKLTDAYLYFAPFDNVKPISGTDALKRIRSILAHALKLRNVLSKRSGKHDQSSAQYGEQLIAKHFDTLAGRNERAATPQDAVLVELARNEDATAYIKHRGADDNLDFKFLMTYSALLVEACERAKTDLLGSNSAEHFYWDQWVDAISRVLKDNKLPSGASKSGSSRFVNLIDEIQNRLPAQYTRHMSSPDTLAQAINRAREQRRSGDMG